MNFNQNLSDETVNELIESGAWERFGLNINEAAAPAVEKEGEEKAEKEDKAKKAKKPAKAEKEEGEEEVEESTATHSCPLCSSELDEALTREAIDSFGEALNETYAAEYKAYLNGILEDISDLDEDDLDAYLDDLEENVMEDINILLNEDDKE